jgi:hypothetical protein
MGVDLFSTLKRHPFNPRWMFEAMFQAKLEHSSILAGLSLAHIAWIVSKPIQA